MTSLLFWGPVLAHKGYMSHKREKQRTKNYERWEGLRDEYDDQRRISRESRSLDIQRTGTWDPVTQQMTGYNNTDDYERGIFTLRDQQEANDARTSWRPQEAWDSPRTQLQAQMTGQVQSIPPHGGAGYPSQPYPAQRHVSMTAAPTGQTQSQHGHLPLRSQKTGATWDEALPARLQVSRQSFDGYDYGRYGGSAPVSANVSRQSSVSRRESTTHTPSGLRSSTPVSQMPPVARQASPPEVEVMHVQELPKNEFGFVDPTVMRQAAPGGRMAELIERGY